MTKKLLVAMFAVGFVLSMASQSQAIVDGSGHDFANVGGWAFGPEPLSLQVPPPAAQLQLCVSCHTPHNGDNITMPEVPLWNHLTSTEVYGIYDNTASTQDTTPPAAITGVSLACLSCHDDTTFMDAYGASAGSGNMTTVLGGPSSAALGTDLSNDHPVGISYTDAIAGTDGELNPPTTTNSGLGGFITGDMLYGATDTIECASCHDVHNTQVDLLSGYMLRLPMLQSQLCTTCHIK